MFSFKFAVLIFGILLFLSQRLPIYKRSSSNAGYTVLLEEVAEELRQINAVESEKKLCIPRNKTLGVTNAQRNVYDIKYFLSTILRSVF